MENKKIVNLKDKLGNIVVSKEVYLLSKQQEEIMKKNSIISISLKNNYSFSAIAGQDVKLVFEKTDLKVGDALEYDQTYKRVKIVADIQNVLISIGLTLPFDFENGYYGIIIFKNGVQINNAKFYDFKANPNSKSIFVTNYPISVQQNDYLEFYLQTGQPITNKSLLVDYSNYITIECIK